MGEPSERLERCWHHIALAGNNNITKLFQLPIKQDYFDKNKFDYSCIKVVDAKCEFNPLIEVEYNNKEIKLDKELEIVEDLQAGNSFCFISCLSSAVGTDEQFLTFHGNGWAERGYPFFPNSEIDSIEKFYEGNYWYPVIGGKTKDFLLNQFKKGFIPKFCDIAFNFKDIYSWQH